MLPGDYELGTSENEVMEILAGKMEALFPLAASWQSIKAGESFSVSANAKFKLKVLKVNDYHCSYN